ncbi:MAG: hypothetical protein ACKVJG_11040 [Candidatus Latescibacterota bacterium]
MTERRFLGITVLGDYVLNEGVEGVLANMERCGATAVACNPTVTAPAAEGEGSFQPPDDAGSSPRLFDRPLWGKRALWVRSGASYEPTEEFYRDTPYQPRRANDLTAEHGHVIGDFIRQGRAAGLEVYLQVGAAQPPGLLDEDVPRLPDGALPQNRMANTASLASPGVHSYIRAYVRDLLDAYPEITGIRPDWPEYPCYKLDEAFQDFGPHVESWAEERGFDFEIIKSEVLKLYQFLHGGLRNEHLEDWAGPERGHFALFNALRSYPGVAEWLRLKSELSVDLLREWRAALTAYGGEDKKLSANAFMPPLTLFTGFDFKRAARFCSAASPKLYTMHWSAMVEFWGEVLLKHNSGLDEKLVTRALAQLFDLGDHIEAEKLADYGYPEPHEAHPVPDAPQKRRIAQAKAAAGEGMAITPLVHGYGPVDDFARRLKLVAESEADGVWINRYGYLGDEKIAAIAEIWR